MVQKTVIERISLMVSLACNLKCRLCAVNAPYHNLTGNVKKISASQHLEYIRKLFSVVDYVDYFSISGGEPLIYNELPELMEGLLDYSEKYKYVDIHTNGTTLPSDELLSVIKKYGRKFKRVLVDNYGESSKKVAEIACLLERHNIPFEIRDYHSENVHCGGWVDFGSLDKIIRSESEAAELFLKCAFPQKMNFAYFFYQGCLTPCASVQKRFDMGVADTDDYVDLNDNSLSAENFKKKILNINNINMLNACLYCNDGMCDDSVRYMPGEQLTAEESACIKRSFRDAVK